MIQACWKEATPLILYKMLSVYIIFICLCTLYASKDKEDSRLIFVVVAPMFLQGLLSLTM